MARLLPRVRNGALIHRPILAAYRPIRATRSWSPSVMERPGSAPCPTRHLALQRFQPPPPFRPQNARPLGIALVEKPGSRHPVRAEASEVLAQLAPGDQVADGLHVADRHRPDDTLALAALLVAIAQRD